MKTLKIIFLFLWVVTFTSCTNNTKDTHEAELIAQLVVQVSQLEAENLALAQVKPETLSPNMNMYVIEREIPALGDWPAEDLKGASQTSCGVLKEMGSEIKWLHSYVTGDKMYCVYLAANEEMVREHAKKGGFPANEINSVGTIISPETAE